MGRHDLSRQLVISRTISYSFPGDADYPTSYWVPILEGLLNAGYIFGRGALPAGEGRFGLTSLA